MAVQFTDREIAALIAERKELPSDYQQLIQTKARRGHKESELDVVGAKGSEFRLILRQSSVNSFDFSVILAYRVPKSNVLFRLRRYNGKHGEHTNTLEGQTFYDYHVHMATERYQESGLREDTYAEPTDRYADFGGAVKCLIEDCKFVLPRGLQSSLF
jgi:hypothetical protein